MAAWGEELGRHFMNLNFFLKTISDGTPYSKSVCIELHVFRDISANYWITNFGQLPSLFLLHPPVRAYLVLKCQT